MIGALSLAAEVRTIIHSLRRSLVAEIARRVKINATIMFTVDEEEARALDALAGYGDNEFIKVFYEKLGKAYMRDHEQGLRRFLKSIRSIMSGELSAIDDLRRTAVGKRRRI